MRDYWLPKNTKRIQARNVAGDFNADYAFLGKTKNGRIKLGEITGEDPARGINITRHFLTKPEFENGRKKHRIRHGGSPFNTYIYYE